MSNETDNMNSMRIKALGAGQEVGRSCVLIQFRGKSILFDCGIHPGKNGRDSLPLLDDIKDVELDCILITHFHSDHCAALPYLMTRNVIGKSRPKIFMTKPTYTLYEYVTKDFIRKTIRGNAGAAAAARSGIDLSSTFGNESGSNGSQLYEEKDIAKTNECIEIIGFDETKEHKGIKITCLNAGHVLGACMFLVDIDEKRVLYTGDFSCQEDHHLMAAKAPSVPGVDVLIIESTYGINNHDSREKREKDFLTAVRSCIDRGGKCLIPMFALGRAQELMLILEEYWAQHPELAEVPLWFCSSMADKYLDVYQHSTEYMNDRVKGATANPFDFPHFSKKQFNEDITDPCVVIAGPGMLQNGTSRRIFERWCEDERNTILIAGYCIDGTLGSDIQKNPKEVSSMKKQTLKLRATVVTISFSAHTDFSQTNGFIKSVKPRHIYLVHGEKTNISKLHKELRILYGPEITVYYLVNSRDFTNPINLERDVNFVGSIAAATATPLLSSSSSSETTSTTTSSALTVSTTSGAGIQGQKRMFSGIFINDNGIKFISPADIAAYTPMKVAKVHQRQTLSFHASLRALYSAIGPLCDDIVLSEDGTSLVLDGGRVSITKAAPKSTAISLEWNSSVVTDMLVDSIIAIALRLDSNPLVAVKAEERQPDSVSQDNQMKILLKSKYILKKHFGNATVDGSKIRINFGSPSEEKVEDVVKELRKSIMPISFKKI